MNYVIDGGDVGVLTLVLLNLGVSSFKNSVDPDQLAHQEVYRIYSVFHSD